MSAGQISSWMACLLVHSAAAWEPYVCMPSDAKAQPRTNRELIAAMPPRTESVIVWRVSALKSDESVFRSKFPDNAVDDRHHAPATLEATVGRECLRAGLLVMAWGGSDFEIPHDTGMTGNYNKREMYIVESPLDKLRRQLDAGQGVGGLVRSFDFDGVKVFEEVVLVTSNWEDKRKEVFESRFVAIPDRHTVLLAESREDLEHMITSLKAKSSAIPARWRSAAKGHDLESAVVILRKYPPATGEASTPIRLWLPRQELALREFALTLIDVKHVTLNVSMTSHNPEEVIKLFKSEFFSEPPYVWNVRQRGDNVDATVTWRGENEEHDLLFSLILLFGACVMI